MNEMVIEPGTGLLVHKSESDGEYNAVTSPLNNTAKYLKGVSQEPKFSRHSKVGWGISDRSGFRYPMSQMIEEPGTGLLIHFTESDGEYNAVTSPLNTITIDTSDASRTIDNARPDIDYEVDMYLTNEDDDELTDQYDKPVEID
jgi:hypothetical protein